jgi:hypothetical protein
MPRSVETGRSRYAHGGAKRLPHRRFDWRPLRDAAVAAVAFLIVSSALACNNAKAGTASMAFAALEHGGHTIAVEAVAEKGPLPIVHIATAKSPSDAVYRQTSATAAWGLLGVAFSILAALDLALLRHLKRVYATPFRRLPPEK